MSDLYTATVNVSASTPEELAELLELAADRVRRKDADQLLPGDPASGVPTTAEGEGTSCGTYDFTVRAAAGVFTGWTETDTD